MLLRLFYKNDWYNPFLLLLAGLLLWRNAFLNPGETSALAAENGGALFDLVMAFFRNHPLPGVILAFAALMFQVFFIAYLASSKVMNNRYSAIAGLIFLLLVSSRPYMAAIQPGHFAGVFLLLAMNKILNTYEEKDIVPQIFNAGLLISLAGLFYYPAWIFFILLIISLFIYYVVSARALMAALTGFIVPLFLMFTLVWVTGQLETVMVSFAKYQQSWMSAGISFSFIDRLHIYLIALLSLVALFSLRVLHMPSKAILTRQRMRTLNIALVFAMLSYLVAGKHLMINHHLLFIPLAVALAVIFEDIGKKTIAETLFLLLAVALVAGNLVF